MSANWEKIKQRKALHFIKLQNFTKKSAFGFHIIDFSFPIKIEAKLCRNISYIVQIEVRKVGKNL